jgi:light-regulated signal transduction histidine kinase (bacteriophytochrome)
VTVIEETKSGRGEPVEASALAMAMLNILDDLTAETERLADTQRALLNILEDFDIEKQRVVQANEDLHHEIAHRKLAEHALRETTTGLARSNAELEQFAYVASHDLQEPLRKITGFCQLLARRYQGQLDERADEYIAFVVDGTARMQQLINDLLTYSRVGRVDENVALVDCNGIVEQVRLDLAAAIEQSGAEVTVAGQLPTVTGTPTRLAQLFANLVGNAVKFHGAAPPRVVISAERRGAEWRFAVSDNGIGIEPQYAERVFGLFQRLHTRAEYPGTGVGLAVCKKIVETEGGTIWFESEPGAGTTFYWTLPAEAKP